MFDHKGGSWHKFSFAEESDYQGGIKFSSICQISQRKKVFLMTGGCSTETLKAVNSSFMFTLPQSIRTLTSVSPMIYARYGHATVSISGYVLALGGFNHSDDEGAEPSTLKVCEKYSPKEKEWTTIAPMN